MSLISCDYCGGEWFERRAHLQLSDEPFVERGEPYILDSRPRFICGECGETLNPTPYEVPNLFKPTG